MLRCLETQSLCIESYNSRNYGNVRQGTHYKNVIFLPIINTWFISKQEFYGKVILAGARRTNEYLTYGRFTRVPLAR